MPLSKELIKQIKCCLNNENDEHIVIEPIVLTCGFNSCKECINDSKDKMIHCYACNGEHEKANQSRNFKL